MNSPTMTNSSDGVEQRTLNEQKDIIIRDREQVLKNVIDILRKKSSIVGVTEDTEKLKFSLHIQKAYLDVYDVFNGRAKVIMQIVASVPDVKIIFLPHEDNIRKFEQDEEPEFKTEGITYAKSEAIIIAAKGYDKTENYRKFLGVIIHEFCHFAVHETFGNGFEPYYANDELAAKKWKKLVNQYKSSDRDEFPIIKELFGYEENKWIQELVVRYPQMFVEHHGSEVLLKFEEHFIDLHSIYIKKVHKEFDSEKEKIASLRFVNAKNLKVRERLDLDSLNTIIDMDFNAHRQILRTNQTYLAMKNIFNHFRRRMNFEITFMFIQLKFLKSDENLKLIEKALQRMKTTYLIIDGHDETYEDNTIKEKLTKLLDRETVGRIILVLHESQISITSKNTVELEVIEFDSSDLSNEFKGSLKIDFQGSIRELRSLVDDIDKFDYSFHELFQRVNYETFTTKPISIGNLHRFETLSYLHGIYQQKACDSWEDCDLNENEILRKLIDEKSTSTIIIECLPSKRITSELLRMCGRLKSLYPNHWIVSAKLFSHDLSNLGDYESNFSEHLSKNILNLKSMEQLLFCSLFKTGKVIILIELIDETASQDKISFEKFAKQFESLKNTLCVFSRLTGPNVMENRKIIKLNVIKTFKSSADNEMSQNDEMFKQTHDKFSEAREFLEEMFDIGQMLFIHDIGLKEKFNINIEAFENLKLQKYGKSAEILEKVLQNESSSEFTLTHNILSMNLWGNALFHQKKYKEAYNKFNEIVQSSFDNIQNIKFYSLLNKAACAFKLKNYIKSITFAEEILISESKCKFANELRARAFSICGFISLHKNNPVHALENFKNAYALSNSDKNIDEMEFYLIQQAYSQYCQKKYEEAIRLLEAIYKTEFKTKPSQLIQLTSFLVWGNVLKDQKSHSAAIEKFENAARLCTSEMDDFKKIYLNNAADCYHDMKSYDKAIELIEAVLKIESDTEAANIQNARSMNLWGLVLKDQKSHSAAIEKFENAAKLCTDKMNVKKKIYLNNAADCYRNLKNYDQAIELIEAALKIKSDTENSKVRNAFSLNLWGLVLKNQKRYSAAIEKFENAASLCTDEMNDEKKRNLNNAASCYHDMKSYDKAIRLTEAALKLESDTEVANVQKARSMNLWGLVLKYQKSYSIAIEKFENAANLCTDEMNDVKKMYLNNQANCYHDMKNYDKAIDLIEAALKIESDTEDANEQNVSSMNLWGCVLKDQHKYSAAIEMFENAVKLCTDEMDEKKMYLNNMADCHHILKSYVKAAELIEASLRIKSDTEAANVQNARSMSLWGFVLESQKNYSEAIDKFENAAKLGPDEMNDDKKTCFNDAANCCHILKSYVKAIELIEAALRIKSDTAAANIQNARSINLWGHVLKDQNNYSEAIEKFKNAAKLCVNEIDVKKKMYLNNAADCYHDMQKYDKAVELIEAALKIKSDTEAANEQNARSMTLWGLVLEKQFNYSAAIQKFESAFELVPGSWFKTITQMLCKGE